MQKLFSPKIRNAALAVLTDGTMTVSEVARMIGADRQTVAAWCKKSATEARRVYVRDRWAQALKESQPL